MKVMTDQMPMLREAESKRANREEAFGILRMIAAIALCIWAWSCAIHEPAAKIDCWAAHGQKEVQK
jgi:hypothetical protein